jgi:hypothetical protein
MLAFISAFFSWLAGRFRSRAELELEVFALRNWPSCVASGPAVPASAPSIGSCGSGSSGVAALSGCHRVGEVSHRGQWHRQGFRLYWRWRSRPGRRAVDHDIRRLIREMSYANPLWGTPRIHGELLKLGIEISQATVAKYICARRSFTIQPAAVGSSPLSIVGFLFCCSVFRSEIFSRHRPSYRNHPMDAPKPDIVVIQSAKIGLVARRPTVRTDYKRKLSKRRLCFRTSFSGRWGLYSYRG